MSSLRMSTPRSGGVSGKRSATVRSTSSVRSSHRRRRKDEEEEESYTLATINLKRRELEVVKDMIQTQIIGIEEDVRSQDPRLQLRLAHGGAFEQPLPQTLPQLMDWFGSAAEEDQVMEELRLLSAENEHIVECLEERRMQMTQKILRMLAVREETLSILKQNFLEERVATRMARLQGLRQTYRQELNGKNGLRRRVQVGEDELSLIFDEESIAMNEKLVASEMDRLRVEYEELLKEKDQLLSAMTSKHDIPQTSHISLRPQMQDSLGDLPTTEEQTLVLEEDEEEEGTSFSDVESKLRHLFDDFGTTVHPRVIDRKKFILLFLRSRVLDTHFTVFDADRLFDEFVRDGHNGLMMDDFLKCMKKWGSVACSQEEPFPLEFQKKFFVLHSITGRMSRYEPDHFSDVMSPVILSVFASIEKYLRVVFNCYARSTSSFLSILRAPEDGDVGDMPRVELVDSGWSKQKWFEFCFDFGIFPGILDRSIIERFYEDVVTRLMHEDTLSFSAWIFLLGMVAFHRFSKKPYCDMPKYKSSLDRIHTFLEYLDFCHPNMLMKKIRFGPGRE